MVHRGAGNYYAPNGCVSITVIPIVVQLGVLQKFDRQQTINNIEPLICSPGVPSCSLQENLQENKNGRNIFNNHAAETPNN